MGNGRILMAPRPGLSGGPSISLLRLQQGFKNAGYQTSSLVFRLTGKQILPFDFSVMMGVPVYAHKLLAYPQPTILIMGKPEDPIESAATHRRFSVRDEIENEDRANVIESAQHVTFISHYVEEIWRNWFFQKRRKFLDKTQYSIIYHGLDLDVFRPAALQERNNIFTIGCVGAIRTPVRVNSIFEVSRRLPFEHQFIVVGSATEDCEKVLSEYASSSKFPSFIKRVKWVDANRLPKQFQQMDCLLHPVDHEGFGIAMSEAMACGVPVVAPNHGAASEIIMGGGYCARVEKFNYNDHFYDELANGIITIRNDLDSYSKMARSVAEKNFNIDHISKKFIEIGNLLIGK